MIPRVDRARRTNRRWKSARYFLGEWRGWVAFGELMLGGQQGDAGHPFRGPPGNAHAL